MSYQKHNFEAGAILFASQLNDMDSQIEILSNQESTLSENFKVALLNCFENVAWANQNGQLYYNELYNALYPDIFWTVTNTLFGCTNSNDTTNVLKNSSYVATIIANEGYTLDGATVNILMGGNNVTNLYYSSGSINIPNVTGNLVITVNAVSAVTSISAVFTQGSATIYDTDSLDTLRQYLTVTATYSDSTTAVVTDYTLSGDLEVGTNVITASYGGKTDSFSVFVTDAMLYSTYNVAISTSEAGVNTGVKLLSEDNTFTILFDANKTTALSAGYRFFYCLQSASPWKGIYVGSSNESGASATDAQWFSARQAFAVGRSTIGRIRILYAHEQGTDRVTFMWKLNDGNIGTFTISNAYIVANGDLYIGSSNASTNFVGTVNKFEVYRTLLGQSAINDFFGDSE